MSLEPPKNLEPEITVVMTAHNAEDYVSLTIESILNQTFENFTFIAVNNGSTDRTGEILNSYAQHDFRLRVRHFDGPSTYVEGRERAISEVETEWFAIIDADDIARPERLEVQIGAIRECGEEVSVFGTWAETINEHGKPLARMIMGPVTIEEFRELYQAGEAIVPLDPSTVVRRSAFEAAGGYRATAVPAADLDLWYRIAENGGAILIIPEFLMLYRIHSNSTSIAQIMLQRKKTHFVNYNMRRRRKREPELSWDLYLSEVWTQNTYRLPRMRNDYGLAYFKRAGHAYAQGNYFRMAGFLCVSAVFKPIHVAKQLIRQKLKSKPG